MRRGRRAPQVTLFPFLSILACVIGTLTLLIAGLAAGAVGEGNVEEYVRIREEARLDADETDRLADEIDQAEALALELERARAELERLERLQAEARAEKGRLMNLLSSMARRREQVAALTAERDSLLTQRRALRSELDRRAGASDTFMLKPSGGGRNLQPRFIECTSSGLLLDPDRSLSEQARVSMSSIPSSSKLQQLFREVKSKTGWSVVFLIRPGGVGAFDKVYRVVKASDAPFGKLPVPGKKKLDFSMYRR